MYYEEINALQLQQPE